MKAGFIIPSLISVACFASSCAQIAQLPSEADGNRLIHNSVIVYDADKDVIPSDLLPYIKQQAPAFSIFSQNTVIYDQSLVSQSVANIEDHMKYLGYYGSSVESTALTAKGGKTTALYVVKAGRRYPIDEVSFDIPQGRFAEDFYRDTTNVTIKPGTYLSESLLDKESERSAESMRKRGYYGLTKNFYSFEADTMTRPGKALLKMIVREYSRNELPSAAKPLEPRTIGSVTVNLSDHLAIRPGIIESLSSITPGELYDEQSIKLTQSRLSSLSVLSSVGITLSESDNGNVDCELNLSESGLQGYSVDMDASTNSSGLIGISPQLKYYHKNLFHGGELFDLSFLGDFQFKPGTDTRASEFGVSSSIGIPRFWKDARKSDEFGTIPRTEVSISYSRQDRPEYERNLFSTSLGYSGEGWQIYPLQVSMVSLGNIDPVFYATLSNNPFMRYSYQDHLDAGAGCTLYYSSVPNTGRAAAASTSRWYAKFGADISGNVISLFNGLLPKDSEGYRKLLGTPYSQYLRTELTLGRTLLFGKDNTHSLAARFLSGIGYAYGNSTALPFEKQFYAGGADSMRGWQARSLGPGSSPLNKAFLIPSQTGDVQLEANLEMRMRLFWKMEGALFVDVGNVWTLNGDDEGRFTKDFYRTIAADWGVGVRCNMDFIIIRLDCGIKAVDPSRSEGDRWVAPGSYFSKGGCSLHFGIGYPF